MHPIDYDRIATEYDSGRAVPAAGLDAWRTALSPYLPAESGRPVLDVGSGTGIFAHAMAEWFGVAVVAVEPSENMRQEAIRLRSHPHISYVVGEAERLPVDDGSCSAAFLSTVIHHIPNLARCARELRRALYHGSPVLIRGSFPGRLDDITLFRFFPAAKQIAEEFPSVDDAVHAFGTAGFHLETLVSVPQQTASSLEDFHQRVRWRADTTLQQISDEDFAWGLEELQRAATHENEPAPVIDQLDLLVLR